MTPENNEFIRVNPDNFWRRKTLEIDDSIIILDKNLEEMIRNKIEELNREIDNIYKVSFSISRPLTFFDKWKYRINKVEREELITQLNKIISWFNQKIEKLRDEYVGSIAQNRSEIEERIQWFFTWKSIHLTEIVWIWAAINAYNTGSMEWAPTKKSKKLKL